MPSWNPDKDIPSLATKVILITGGTAGLGSGSISELAKHGPSHIIFTGRNQKSADALIKKQSTATPNVKLTFIKCDISSFAAITTASTSIFSQTDRLDIVMLNAGIMAVDAAVSEDGYEIQMMTNHLGHALLVRKLLPLLRQTSTQYGDARVVNLTSVAYAQAPSAGIEFATLKTKQENQGGLIPGGKYSRYGQSKLAQMLYSTELAAHCPEITCLPVHPGVIQTALLTELDFMSKIPMLFYTKTPVEQGHWQQCWAATVPKAQVKNGAYYEPVGQLVEMEKRKTRQSRDKDLSRRLWEWTEEQLDAFEAKSGK